MEKILVLDFGGQYNQLIARRVRENKVYAEIKPYNKITVEEIKKIGYKGIIFTGGPNSVNDPDSPHYDPSILDINIPILGICYGNQLIAHMAKGAVSEANDKSEFGKTPITLDTNNKLFAGLDANSICWMSHRDQVSELPEGYRVIASTENCKIASFANEIKNIYAIQFHPEVTHTLFGKELMQNFLFNVCHCSGNWIMDDFIDDSIKTYKEKLKGKKVILGLSGGVDSLVTAVLLNKAIGSNLYCVFVDHGLLRKNEGDLVENVFKKQFNLNVIRVNAEDRFLAKLDGVSEPESKRKIIGNEFVRVFEEEAVRLKVHDCLAQGTIYPDVIESGKGDSAVIKSHHNVNGLPKDMLFKEVVEPLRNLFKDEVRKVGEKLGIPYDLVYRQPFPGPGLGVRIIGEITKEKINILQNADAILREEIEKSGYRGMCSQYFAVLTGIRSVGVMGDARTYGYVVALRSVTTDDFMTASWSKLPLDLLETISNRITNEVNGVSRVVYDITSKPPSTVEWE